MRAKVWVHACEHGRGCPQHICDLHAQLEHRGLRSLQLRLELRGLALCNGELGFELNRFLRELVEKTIELEAKLAIPERETTKLEAKLKRAGAAMFKLRMEVADVLQAEYEATDAQKALLKEAVGTGYGAQESGKRLLICTSLAHSHAYTHTLAR